MGVDLTTIDALGLAQKAGSPKAANVVMLGLLAKELSIPEACWLDAIQACVASKFFELNCQAFTFGESACS